MGILASQLAKTAKLKSTTGQLDIDLTQTFDFSDLRGTLGAALAANNFKITGLASPESDGDAATKGYVDTLINSLAWKDNVTLATTEALPSCTYSNGTSGVGATLTASSTGVLTVDGFTVALNKRILVKNQATPAHNGIYRCTTQGAVGVAFVLTRATDFDSGPEITSSVVQVDAGTANADDTFFTTADNPTMGSTDINWSAYGSSYTAGDGIDIDSGTIAVLLESSDPSLQFSSGELGLKIGSNGGLYKDSGGVYVSTDDSTVEKNGSGDLQLKALGTTPGKLSWAPKSQSLAYTNFTFGAGISSATLSSAIDATSATWGPGLLRLIINGVEMSISGTQLAYDGGSTPNADGEWRINGTTLEVYGDLTGNTVQARVTYPAANS